MSEKKFDTKSLFSAGGLVLMLVIIVLVNVVFSQVNLRWDATNEKLYSLSEGTKTILSNLKQDVDIKVFYTKDSVNTPIHIKNYSSRMLDFLSEYEYHSKGKIKVQVYNTKADSDEEDWARNYGIESINYPTGEKIYFGLVAMSGDQEEAIPMIDPSREEHLEYDITRIISRIQSSKKLKIGIISSLPVFGQPPMPYQNQPGVESWLFVTELKKTYTVEEIKTDTESIDKDTDLLIMVYPKDIGEKLEYAVDQYVLRGGSLIVFADTFSVSDMSPGQAKSSPQKKLFGAWGIHLDTGKLLADFDYATKVRTQNNRVEDNPLWLSVPAETFNADNVITSKLQKILMPAAGTIVKMPGNDYEYEPLLQSSTNSAPTEVFKVRFGTEMIRRDFAALNKKHDLAVRIRGTFKTAFPDGKPKDKDPKDKDSKDEPKEKEPEAEHLAEGQKKSTIVVVADADMLSDNYYVSKQNFLGFNLSRIFNDNLNFLLNTTEVLTGSEELISIRSRGKFERPFTIVQELEKKAQARWLEKEKGLVKEAEETNRKLKEFEKQKDADQRFIMSAEQEAEIEKFKEKKRNINKELKQVRRNLRADIEALGNKIKVINIALMPLLVAFAGIGYGLYRRKKGLRIDD